jgi:hypothetical protein
MKAVAVQTMFLIVVIGMIIFFTLVITWHWLKGMNVQASQATCIIKLKNYCERWYKLGKEPTNPTWEETEPTGCDEFNIYKPTSLEDCKSKLGLG